MTPENFLFEPGQIAKLTFNRPERRNCLTREVLHELDDLLTQVADDDTRVLIITGAGSAFCAGADVSGSKDLSDPAERRKNFAREIKGFPRLNSRALETLMRLDALTIGAVNGFAVGGGWGLASAMDFVFAAETAEFWIPEIALGIPFLGLQTEILARGAGQWLAKELMIVGRHFTAGELLRLRMINRVIAPEQLMAETHAFAEKLLTLPKRAAIATKHAINGIFAAPRQY
jgi:enoyl-CoA hydratase